MRGTAKNPFENDNESAPRVDTHAAHSRVELSNVKLAVSLTKLQYAVAYVSTAASKPRWHRLF